MAVTAQVLLGVRDPVVRGLCVFFMDGAPFLWRHDLCMEGGGWFGSRFLLLGSAECSVCWYQ